jgi:Domain of unknown function (DUF4833)
MRGHLRNGTAIALGTLLLCPVDVEAKEPRVFPFDVPTVFYIAKSDDRNRVDYGIHLDDHCASIRDDAVFQYWREFERAPPVRIHELGMFDYIPYGISEQRSVHKTATGGVHLMRLRQFKFPIEIVTEKRRDGRCGAQARVAINGKESELVYVFVQLGKSWPLPSVAYVDLHGRDLDTGYDIEQRILVK